MNPDLWMPYYGQTFENHVKGFRREIKWSYLSAVWHYWSVTHCEGLPDDDETLMLICECSLSEWSRTKGLIFGPLFVLQNGKWHNKFSKELHHESKQIYEERVERARNARSNIKPNIKGDIKHSQPTHPDVHVDVPVSSPSSDGDKGLGKGEDDTIATVRSALCIMYGRKWEERWMNDEEHALVEVCHREGVSGELQEVRAYKSKEEAKYFPHTILRLLQRWTETLDKARNFNERNKPSPSGVGNRAQGYVPVDHSKGF